MENDVSEMPEQAVSGETPEDVAVLYSWANLQGAKYRDFSASRREYRAQMRLRAAEEQRLAEARAQAEAEAAAIEAEKAAREAEEAARFHEEAARRAADARRKKDLEDEEDARQRALRQAQEMSRVAAAERMEASRRAEAVVAAEAAARREAREMREARASAQRQAAQYEEESRRSGKVAAPRLAEEVPGQISDPYSTVQQTMPGRLYHQPTLPEEDMMPSRHPQTRDARLIVPRPDPEHMEVPVAREYIAGSLEQQAARAALGVEEAGQVRQESRRFHVEPDTQARMEAVDQYARAGRTGARGPARQVDEGRNGTGPELRYGAERGERRMEEAALLRAGAAAGRQRTETTLQDEPMRPSRVRGGSVPGAGEEPMAPQGYGMEVSVRDSVERVAGPAAVARAEAAARRGRGYAPDEASGFFPAYGSARGRAMEPREEVEAPVVPEWIHASSGALKTARPRMGSDVGRPLSTPAATPVETLQHSRERVAARWFALKGIFEHDLQEQKQEQQQQRGEDGRVPFVAVFSLAGGVGKTSLVATLGRALSGAGEKVLLTDTTSHGLLPFYFGASELRPGMVRTFSPPAGAADAPIHLVSYDVLQRAGDAASQQWLTEEMAKNSRGTSRVLLDVSASSPWVARMLAQSDATVLVPLAPDMNSVISLGAIEAFFTGMKNRGGKKVEPLYVLNKFDSSQALHLDVREVMRQKLDDRLLPFTIRQSMAIPEALAEGMTVMDYCPEAPIAEDYRHLANWLKSSSAPASYGQASVRWSER